MEARSRTAIMNFLEAHRVVTAFTGGEKLPFLLGMSGTPDPLILYLRAQSALRGRAAEVRTLPFNTLGQHLLGESAAQAELIVLLPWDLVPEADWRSGIPATAPDEPALRARAERLSARLAHRGAAVLYIAAPLPPIWTDPDRTAALDGWMQSLMRGIGATIRPAEDFALGTYLASGCPIAGVSLDAVAEAGITRLVNQRAETAKVLVTDLDNTLWAGIVGDDGPEGIRFRPDGAGFPHFLYQTFLRRLRDDGVLLAAVSKNQPGAALAPFQAGEMVLRENDFVAVMASWNAKSAQIRELAAQLNLGLDAFVFVDDNPVELAEVEIALPAVRRILFPSTVAGLPALFDQVAEWFARREVSDEDRRRTELYRQRLAGLAPSTLEGADLSAFLRDLDMTLTIQDHSTGDRTRAVQLINKTNQFNLNGRRVTDHEIGRVLASGGRLLGVTLADRTGSHGEILTCLMGPDGVIRSMVMSCRVFQRRVEFAFLAWLVSREPALRSFDFLATEKNEPLRQFLSALHGTAPRDGSVPLIASAIASAFAGDLALFHIDDQMRS